MLYTHIFVAVVTTALLLETKEVSRDNFCTVVSYSPSGENHSSSWCWKALTQGTPLSTSSMESIPWRLPKWEGQEELRVTLFISWTHGEKITCEIQTVLDMFFFAYQFLSRQNPIIVIKEKQNKAFLKVKCWWC